MSDRPWYKRYPADFIAGTLSLKLEEKGAYSVVLDLMYDRGGPIPDDPQWVARVCGCSTRRWNKIRETLIQAGKITAADGCLSNERAEKQIENDAKTARKLSESGAKGAEKTNEKKASSRENNNLSAKRPTEKSRHTRNQKPETRDIDAKASTSVVVEMPVMPAMLDRRGSQFVHERCCEIAGVDPSKDMRWVQTGTVASWLNSGADPERDIYPTLQAIMAKRTGPPGSMAYFTQAVADAKATRERPLPAGRPSPQPQQSPHEAMYNGFAAAAAKLTE